MKFFLGTSGYSYKDWKTVFYPYSLPQKKWLQYYSEHFDTVEINTTFYGFSREESFARWYQETPSLFVFSVKGSRLLTHIKRLNVTKEETERFFSLLLPFQEKLSCVLWQVPENFGRNSEHIQRLERFLSFLPTSVKQCIEFRDSTWFIDSIWALLEKYHVGFVISETSEFPTCEKITADFAYLRFHGPTKLYASSYSDEQLIFWAEKIRSFLKDHDVYCYFNNDYGGRAIENARTITHFIQQGH